MNAFALNNKNRLDRRPLELLERAASVLNMKPTEVGRQAILNWCPAAIAERQNSTQDMDCQEK